MRDIGGALCAPFASMAQSGQPDVDMSIDLHHPEF
jgi:hypothetical protein